MSDSTPIVTITHTKNHDYTITSWGGIEQLVTLSKAMSIIGLSH